MTEIFENHIRSFRKISNHSFRNLTTVFKFNISVLRRSEREAIKEMLPVLSSTLEYPEKDLEIYFIKSQIEEKFSDLKHLKEGLKELLEAYE